MLRTELMKVDMPIYSVDWNSDDDYVVCGTNKIIYLKPLQPGQREMNWKAHEGAILKLSWNSLNN